MIASLDPFRQEQYCVGELPYERAMTISIDPKNGKAVRESVSSFHCSAETRVFRLLANAGLTIHFMHRMHSSLNRCLSNCTTAT